MTDLTDRLARVVELCERARKGPWRWSINGNVMAPGSGDVDEICAVYTDDEATGAPNAPAIIAAVNWCRDDAPALLAEVGESKALLKMQTNLIKSMRKERDEAVGLLRRTVNMAIPLEFMSEIDTFLANHGAVTGEGNDPQT